jgi:hypothetical protein
MLRSSILVLLLLAAAACNTTTPPQQMPPVGDAGVGGLAGDLGFPVTSAVEVHSVDEFGFVVGYGFALSNLGFTCSQFEALDGGSPGVPYLEVLGGVACSSGCGPPVPGTYTVETAGAANQEIGFVHLTQAVDGGIPGGLDAQSGSITFSYATTGQLAGAFDVMFNDPTTNMPSELQGTFNVVYCP